MAPSSRHSGLMGRSVRRFDKFPASFQVCHATRPIFRLQLRSTAWPDPGVAALNPGRPLGAGGPGAGS